MNAALTATQTNKENRIRKTLFVTGAPAAVDNHICVGVINRCKPLSFSPVCVGTNAVVSQIDGHPMTRKIE